MDTQRQRLAERLFKELLELPAPARDARLADHARHDPALAHEVRALLSFAALDTGPLEAIAPPDPPVSLSRLPLPDPSAPSDLADPDHLAPGAVIGRYTLLRVLGEGGMGVVYVAQQERPNRTVALKIIRPECSTPSMRRRFEYEAEILGKLQHPGIAQVIEAGIAAPPGATPAADPSPAFSAPHSRPASRALPSGKPFLAMELIDGAHISAHVRDRNLPIRDRVALIVLVCEAVEHAHQRGIIHRDLKPANIMVDRSGQPKVLDFGVARAVAPDSGEPLLTIAHTRHRQLIGTLAYMSPEQVNGASADLDTRSDVYSLGVVLYELLTGLLPHDLADRSLIDSVRIISEETPKPPSAITPECRGDLDTIVLKSLEKDRARRYQSAAELAADLRRYLNHAPIAARPASAMYTLRKFAARNRKLVAALSALAAALVLGFAGTLSGFIQARRDRDEAHRARLAAESATKFVLTDIIASAAPTTPDFKNITHAAVLRQAAKQAPARFAADPRTRHQVLDGLGTSLFELGDYPEALGCFRRSLAAAQEAFGDDAPECVRPLLVLSTSLDALGLHPEANERRAQALQTASRRLPRDHPDALDARGAVLFMSVAYGNARDAEDELRALLAEYDQTGYTHGNTYTSLAEELARTLIRKGRLDEGLAIRRALIQDYRERYGVVHVNTLSVTVRFVETLYECGYTPEALELGRRTLSELLQVYEAGSDRVLFCRQLIAEILLNLGRNEESLAEMRDCMKYIVPDRAPSRLDAVKYDFALAQILCANGLVAEALPVAQRSYDVQREYFGESHDITLDALFILGRAIALTPGRADEGLAIMRRSIADRIERKLAVFTSHRFLAYTLDTLGRRDEAITELQLAVNDSLRATNPANPTPANPNPANPNLATPTVTNPRTRLLITELANLLEAEGRHDAAASWRKRLVATKE